MKRILPSILAAGMLLGMLSGCGASTSSSGSSSGEPALEKGSITIKYSTWANDGEAAYEGMEKFKELVEANQAGSTNEQVEQVSMNQLQMMSSGDPGIIELEYLCLPYLFDSLDNYSEFMATELGQSYIQKGVDERNTLILDTLPRSPRIISSNIAINKLADM